MDPGLFVGLFVLTLESGNEDYNYCILFPTNLDPCVYQGFGLGFAVTADPASADRVCSPGALHWAGVFGSNYFVDPVEMCVGVLLTQRFPALPPGNLRDRYQQLIYQAHRAPPPPSSSWPPPRSSL